MWQFAHCVGSDKTNGGKQVRRLFMIIFLASLVGIAAPASAITALYFESSPNSFVGQGQTTLITPADGYTFVASLHPQLFGFDADLLASFSSPTAPSYWQLFLTGPFKSIPLPGTYVGAQREGFESPGHPGLDFTGDFRGNNTLTGSFTVLEAVYGGQSVAGGSIPIQAFAVDFIQFDEGKPDAEIFGSWRFNSSIPLTIHGVPAPGSLPLCAAGLALLVFYRSKARHRLLQGTGGH
jgi:hypothetical protein